MKDQVPTYHFNADVYNFVDSAFSEVYLRNRQNGIPFDRRDFNNINLNKENLSYKKILEMCSEFGKCKLYSGAEKMYYAIYDDGASIAYLNPERQYCRFVIVGSDEFITKWEDKYKSKETRPEIRWTFTSGDRTMAKDFFPEARPVKDEFYPFLKEGVEKFIDRYFESTASILLLLGPPGTGKTSFIRHLLCSRKKKAMVTFDDRVMTSDSYFVEYMDSDYWNLMIMEDADILLSSRQKDGNRVMNKLLNASDGLIPSFKKKMIFSTNIDSLGKVDPALIRPGRCFDVVHFRQLSHAESNKVCDVMELPRMKDSSKEYTLSELFGQKDEADYKKPLKNLGSGFGFI